MESLHWLSFETVSGKAELMTKAREPRRKRRWLSLETGSGEAKSGTETLVSHGEGFLAEARNGLG